MCAHKHGRQCVNAWMQGEKLCEWMDGAWFFFWGGRKKYPLDPSLLETLSCTFNSITEAMGTPLQFVFIVPLQLMNILIQSPWCQLFNTSRQGRNVILTKAILACTLPSGVFEIQHPEFKKLTSGPLFQRI